MLAERLLLSGPTAPRSSLALAIDDLTCPWPSDRPPCDRAALSSPATSDSRRSQREPPCATASICVSERKAQVTGLTAVRE
jgi:hypothetical protein